MGYPRRNNISCCSLDGVQKGARGKVCPKHRYHKMACSMVYSKSLVTNVVKTFSITTYVVVLTDLLRIWSKEKLKLRGNLCPIRTRLFRTKCNRRMTLYEKSASGKQLWSASGLINALNLINPEKSTSILHLLLRLSSACSENTSGVVSLAKTCSGRRQLGPLLGHEASSKSKPRRIYHKRTKDGV